MWFIVFWIILALLIGVYAARLGRSGILGFFVSLLISPIIAVFLYLALGESDKSRANRLIADQDLIEAIRRENEGGPKVPKSSSSGVGGVLVGIFIIAVLLVLIIIGRS